VTGQGAALADVKVLDLSSLYAGPLIATMLGDFGADVVKVEHPRGDDARRWGQAKDGVPLWWKVLSRNKRLIALDLNDEGDRRAVRRLIDWADVVVENFRPGRLEKWGLGYEELRTTNPGLILVRVTGFGQTGPRASEPGFGTLAEAYSGFAAITGAPDGPPTLPAFGLADGIAGTTGTAAVLTALHWRDGAGGGAGQVVDLSLYEPLFGILGPQVIEYDQLGILQKRQGNRSPRTAPRNAYATADGRWVALSAGTQQIANRVFAAIGRPELAADPRFSSATARRENSDAINEIVAAWIRTRPLEEVLATFSAAEAPLAPVLEADQIVTDPHYVERGSIMRTTDPDLGEITMQAPAPRLSATPGRVRWTGRTDVNADAATVYADVLGMTEEEAKR
jgi:crotonobetainyl-CoA:carnitine CoA-transferase CaiB-like acyl-CoA transferase